MAPLKYHIKPKQIKGALEVRALRNTQMGSTEAVEDQIPRGSVGYVLAARFEDRTYLIAWKALKQVGSHPIDDVEPTGKRG